MSAFIFAMTTPLLPLLLRKSYKKEEKLSARETIFRYAVYTFMTTVITTLIMVILCDEGTSFLEKVDRSPLFALKFLAAEIFAALLIAAAEWWYEARRLEVAVDVPSFRDHIAVRFLRRTAPFGIYMLAFIVAMLNVTLIFDNVLWGDEAFSANLVRNNPAGMLQIISLLDSHPPLYYYWLKMWVGLLGHSGTIFHLASLSVFLIGLILTVTLVRKRYGKIPAAFFVIFTGMSEMCLTYNVEIRMYAMAFLATAFCYYCAGRLLEENRPVSWVSMVFWGLIAAYSHYFALLAVTIMMVVTCLLAVWRFGVKTWIRSIVAGVLFIAAYMPWMQYMIKSVNSVKGNWWLDKSVPLGETVSMLFGGANMTRLLLPLTGLMLVLFFLVWSAVVEGRRTEDKIYIRIRAPRADTWPVEGSVLFAGLSTIVLTIVIAYLADIVYRPILSARYVYPLGGVAAMMLVTGSSYLLKFLKSRQEVWKKAWLETAGKGALLLILAAMLLIGVKDYRKVNEEAKYQSALTEETLYLIGEPVEDMVLVSYGVKHIGWTVLEYYYPEAQVINDNYRNIEADDFWYFVPDFLSESDFAELSQRGYTVGGYGRHQIATYNFVVYHFFKE